MRAGYSGAQRNGLVPWSGDVSRSWGGLQSQPDIALQMGLQGIAFMHSDDFSFAGVKSAISHINWYSEYLKAFEEPILIDSLTTEIYRFTYLRTFDNPIVIRLESNNDSVIIYWKVLDGKGGYSIGKIIENKSKVLIADEWENVEKQINSIKYWSLGVDKEIIGEDGSQWILEGKKLGKYHVVDRWCGGKISSVCKELIKLTDLKIEDIY
jgi:hypothetical protein